MILISRIYLRGASIAIPSVIKSVQKRTFAGVGHYAESHTPGGTRPPLLTCDAPRGCATLWERRDGPVAPAAGDWLSGRAPRSHRGGHWFDPSIAHDVRPVQRLHGQLSSYAPDGSFRRIGRNLGACCSPVGLPGHSSRSKDMTGWDPARDAVLLWSKTATRRVWPSLHGTRGHAAPMTHPASR